MARMLAVSGMCGWLCSLGAVNRVIAGIPNLESLTSGTPKFPNPGEYRETRRGVQALASDTPEQVAALEWVNDPDADLDSLQFCYDYPFKFFFGVSMTQEEIVPSVLPSVWYAMESIYSKITAIYIFMGTKYSDNGCASWRDETPVNEESDFSLMTGCVGWKETHQGFFNSVGKAMRDGVANISQRSHQEYIKYPSGWWNFDDVVDDEWYHLPETFTSTSTSDVLHMGDAQIALVTVGGTETAGGNQHVTFPDNTWCVDEASGTADYEDIINYWQMPFVLDSNIVIDTDYSVQKEIINAYDVPTDTLTVGYIYAYYVCDMFFANYYVATSSTEPEITSTTSTDDGIPVPPPIPPVDTTEHQIDSTEISEATTTTTATTATTTSKQQNSGTGSSAGTSNGDNSPVTQPAGDNVAVIISGSVGAATGMIVTGLFGYLMYNRWEPVVELEEPEVFGSGTYGCDDDLEAAASTRRSLPTESSVTLTADVGQSQTSKATTTTTTTTTKAQISHVSADAV